MKSSECFIYMLQPLFVCLYFFSKTMFWCSLFSVCGLFVELLWMLGVDGSTSNGARLKTTRSAILLASPLLLIFACSGSYYECSPPLWQSTAANLLGSRSQPIAELGIIVCWCAILFLFRTVFASMPRAAQVTMNPQQCGGFERLKHRLGRLLAWSFWMLIVVLFSLPSILFAFSQALPAHNTSGLNAHSLNLIHRTAPALTVLIDMSLAVRVSETYSSLTGLHADRLLMSLRLCSAWLIPLLVTVVLDENCASGWKWTWIVCEAKSTEHRYFDWNIFDERILSTAEDICGLTDAWWSDGRCSRAIIGNLTPFLLRKLLTRSTLQPLLILLAWQMSFLQRDVDPEADCHLRVFGFGPRTSKSLRPVEQMPLLTTQFEILAFWTPFIPLLSIGILVASTANLLIFDLGLWSYGVRLRVNENAALSASYLSFALLAGAAFQLWHAFSTGIYGRYMLLSFDLVVLGPWAARFLPLDFCRRHIWAERPCATDGETIEMTIPDRGN